MELLFKLIYKIMATFDAVRVAPLVRTKTNYRVRFVLVKRVGTSTFVTDEFPTLYGYII